MGETAFGADLGAGDAESGVGEDAQEGAVFVFQEDGLVGFEDGARGVELGDTGFLDELDEGVGAAVADGGFVGVHFDNGVVHAHAGEGGEDVFDGMDFGGPLDDGGCAFDLTNVRSEGVEERFVRKIPTAKFIAVIGRRWVKG